MGHLITGNLETRDLLKARLPQAARRNSNSGEDKDGAVESLVKRGHRRKPSLGCERCD